MFVKDVLIFIFLLQLDLEGGSEKRNTQLCRDDTRNRERKKFRFFSNFDSRTEKNKFR